MATQLRLVDPPPTEVPAPRAARSSAPARRSSPARRGRVNAPRTTSGSSRRAVRWGDWQLDASTRRIGRAGIAAAREALQQAVDADPLSRAS
ncbi:MAG TPA: hypothetical protein VFZ17_07575 [Acidimicrobiia bacterium]|nr:hypothetical protein [Acidimicrobiia bacterium]